MRSMVEITVTFDLHDTTEASLQTQVDSKVDLISDVFSIDQDYLGTWVKMHNEQETERILGK